MELIKMYGELGISEKVLNYGREIEKSLHDRFEAIDKTAEYNQLKVIKAMQEARVSDIHFAGTTGYGYNDLGRDTLEEVYAKAFHGEDALVRPQLISGRSSALPTARWIFFRTVISTLRTSKKLSMSEQNSSRSSAPRDMPQDQPYP